MRESSIRRAGLKRFGPRRSGLGSGGEAPVGVRAGLLAVCLIVGVLAAILTSRTPAPRGVETAPEAFSAARAMADDRVIARVPHPEGSAAALDARNYIVGRMAALGLTPRRVTSDAVEVFPRLRGVYASGGVVENLIGVLPGTDRAAPAILLMAHSDSVPGSPGAVDDAAGVISALETVRALKAAGPRRRDVIVLITDGEEVGLLGARAFFASGDPLLKHIGMIVNMEARGGGGRVAMFETGAGNGAAMGLFARAVKNTDALSLMSEIYKHLPNSTDFTVSKGAGYPGYNFAFVGREFDYHSPSSTPAALDQGSVQHMGDQALALTRALVDAPTLPARTHDAIYGDVFGGPVIVYPALVGWLVLVVSAGLAAFGAVMGARRSGAELGAVAVLRGVGAALCVTLGTALLLHLANKLLAGDVVRYRNVLAQYRLLFAGVSALTGGTALLLWRAAFAGRGRWVVLGLALAGGLLDAVLSGGLDPFGLGLSILTALLALSFGKPLQGWSGWLGMLIVGVVLTLLLQALGPPLTVATAWPLLLGAIAIAIVGGAGEGGFDRPAALAGALAPGLIAAIQLGHVASLIFTAVGPDMPEAMALIPLLAAFALYPLLRGWGETPVGTAAAGALAALGAILLAIVLLRDPASARTPHPVQAFYLDDAATGRTWRASALPRLDPWSRAALDAGGATPARQAMTPVFDTVWLTPASSAGLARPTFASAVAPAQDGRRVILTLTPNARGREVRLYLQPTTPLTDVLVDGHATELAPRPGRWVQLRWDAPRGPITLSFTAPAGGALDLRYQEIADGWPAGMAAPPKPATVMPWGLSDDTVLTDRFQPRW